MRKGILIGVALAALGIAGLFAYRGRSHDGGDEIRISGNIELTEVKIAFKTAGKLIARAVDEGDVVKKGMVVARLDQDQLVNQLETQKAGLRSAESLRSQAATTLEWQTQTVAGDIEGRKADLSQAEAKLQELEAGSRPQEIQQASAAVDAARTEYERAQKDWDRAQTLYKDEDISTAQFDQFRSRFEGGAAALKQAEQRLAMVHEGPRKEEIAAARAQVSRAKASVQMAEANRIDLKRRLEEITTRQAEIGRTHAQSAIATSGHDGRVSDRRGSSG
jgi:HlyD family secretion protein